MSRHDEMREADAIIDSLDDMFIRGEWERADQYLQTVDLTALSLDGARVIGMWSKHAKDHLPSRPAFLIRLKDELLRRGQPNALVQNTIARYS